MSADNILKGKRILAVDDEPDVLAVIDEQLDDCHLVRAGDFKAVWEKRERQWKLYDLATDQTETRDLAALRPELTRTLAARWCQWADMTEVTYSND